MFKIVSYDDHFIVTNGPVSFKLRQYFYKYDGLEEIVKWFNDGLKKYAPSCKDEYVVIEATYIQVKSQSTLYGFNSGASTGSILSLMDNFENFYRNHREAEEARLAAAKKHENEARLAAAKKHENATIADVMVCLDRIEDWLKKKSG